jgi:TolB-like protein
MHFLTPLLLLSLAISVLGENAVKKNIAVMTLKASSGINQGEAELLTERLSSELFRTGKVNVMERNQMQDVLKEQGFQVSGACTDDACLVEMGQMLGVQVLVAGSIGKLGSMYMINLRSIDVSTAKIIKLVSEDVKGDIEDVVGLLRTISTRLLDDQSIVQPAVTPSEPEIETEPVVAESTTVSNVQEKVEEIEKVEPEEDDSEDEKNENVSTEKDSRNKNRGGIRLAVKLYPGDGPTLFLDTFKIDQHDLYSETKAIKEFQLTFFIPIWKFFAVNLGPVFSIGSQSAISGTDSTITVKRSFITFGFHPGVNFTKKWYPLKVNAGVDLELDYLILPTKYTYNQDINNSTYSYDFHEKGDKAEQTEVDKAGGVGVTFKAEVEYLASPNVGINLGANFRVQEFSDFSDGIYENSYDYDSFTSIVPSFVMPMFGISVGINFYWGSGN